MSVLALALAASLATYEFARPAAAKAAASLGTDTQLDYVTFRSLVQGKRKARHAGPMGRGDRSGNSPVQTFMIIKKSSARTALCLVYATGSSILCARPDDPV